MPSFNSEKTIVKTIRSIRDQSFKDWELLIIDDGSTDTTCSLIETEIAEDDRIVLMSRPSDRLKGANACRNMGIEQATGNYVAFMDSDDAWKVNRLENAIGYLKSTNCDAIYSGAEISDGHSIVPRGSRAVREGEPLIDFVLSGDSFAPTPSLVVKTASVKQIKFDESLKRHQDYDFFIRFGKSFQWCFFDNFDVIVNWTKGSIRNVDFDSCITFYERNKEDIKDKRLQLNYLFNMRQNSIESNSPALNYYNSTISSLFYQVGLKQKIMILFPGLLKIRKSLSSLVASTNNFK